MSFSLLRACAALCALTLIAVASTAMADGGAAYADALARTLHHEGVPEASAQTLNDDGVERLADLLADPGEARHHAQIIVILGMSGHPQAADAVLAAAVETHEGEVDRAILRKQVAIRSALGRLARHDDRALTALRGEANAEAITPTWSCGRHQGTRLGALLRRSTLTGLALSGRPEAKTLLRRLRRNAQQGATRDTDLERHATSALALHQRVAADAGVERPRRPR